MIDMKIIILKQDRQISSSYYERYLLFDCKKLPTINKTINEEDCSKLKKLDAYSLEILNSFYKLREKN